MMEEIRVYYLEDEKDTFSILKKELDSNGFVVFPKTLKDWSDELLAVKKYLKANDEEKAKLKQKIIEIFKKPKADLFIFDYYLIETEYKSTTIFDEIIKKDSVLTNLPLIFLTIEDKMEQLPIDNNTGFVLKQSYLSDGNASATSNLLMKEITKFPELLKKLTTQKNANSSVVNWMRINF